MPTRGRIAADGLYNYHALAGCGSDTFQALSADRSWRVALLGTVATGALWMMAPRPARAGPDACTTVGATATCTGDQSNGITSAGATDFDPATVDTLNVNSLTTNIMPASGTSGIFFRRTGLGDTVTVNSNTSPFSISVTGANTYGIFAYGYSGTTVSHTGDVNSANGIGIFAHSFDGAVTVTSSGAIAADDDGLVASSLISGDVTVQHTGDVTSTNGNGIYARSSNDATSVTSSGTITAGLNGIHAFGHDALTLTHTGDITSTNGNGIYARASNGTASVTSNGTIAAYADGIYARGDFDVTISHTGDIGSANGIGIFARSNYAVTVTGSGNITTAGDGIYATGFDGDVTVQRTGDITSIGNGIRAVSSLRAVSIINHGAISSTIGNGIEATGYGDVTVDQTGDVRSVKYNGIVATSSAGAATVNSTGDITTGIGGIRASGALNVDIDHRGDIDANAGAGIFAGSGGGLQIQNTGDIRASSDGIRVDADDDITVKQTGDTTAHGGNAIRATSVNGAVQIEIDGGISATADGIYAKGASDLALTHNGDIVAGGSGMFLFSYAGAVQVGNSGNVTADNTGIFAYSKSGAVTVTQTGDISATNVNGILARSLSGTVDVESSGQIIAGLRGIVAYGTDDVSVVHTGNIAASSDGVFAASTTGDITVMHSGDIFAASGNGIYAKSATGNIDITVNGGTVYSGGGTAYAGIQVVGGSLNTITIGLGATVGGKNWAILGGTGVEFVINYGTVVGNVDLDLGGGGGPNGFFNRAGGRFESGATVDIGTSLGSTFFNAGTLSPGGTGAVQTSTFTVGTGLLQGASGSLEVDVDLANGQADRVTIAGAGIAQLAGTVKPHLMSFGATPQTFTILSAFGVTNQGLTLQDSAVVDYRLIVNPGDVQLQIAGINFAPSGLTPNQQATATNLQQSFLAGGGGLSDLLLLLANEDFATFASSLDHLHPEAYLAQTQALLWSGFDFSSLLFSCPTPLSGTSLMGEESCYWLRPSGRVANLSSHDGYFGFRESAAGLTGGVQGELAPHWYLDMGAGYERSDIDTDTSSARGNVFHGGAALKYIRDRWLFAGSLSGSFARYDTSRFGIPTAGTATADADTASLDARLRIAYAFGSPSFYVKPMVDFDLVGLWRGAIDETGAGALNLHIEDETDWIASAAPAVELGREWRHGDTLWRPYVRVGVRFLSEGDVAATASFAGAPAGVPAFTVTSPLDRTLAEISAGFDVWQSERFSLRVSYDGRFGAHSSDNGGALKLRARF